jgi:hypothetical protein
MDPLPANKEDKIERLPGANWTLKHVHHPRARITDEVTYYGLSRCGSFTEILARDEAETPESASPHASWPCAPGIQIFRDRNSLDTTSRTIFPIEFASLMAHAA